MFRYWLKKKEEIMKFHLAAKTESTFLFAPDVKNLKNFDGGKLTISF